MGDRDRDFARFLWSDDVHDLLRPPVPANESTDPFCFGTPTLYSHASGAHLLRRTRATLKADVKRSDAFLRGTSSISSPSMTHCY